VKPKKTIGLFELDRKYRQAIQDDTGVVLPKEYPIELTPAWRSYCRSNWTAFADAKQRRLEQLAYLDMVETHVIDYYEETKPILPL